MSLIFSTDHFASASRFKTCQDWNREIFGPSDLRQLTDEPFTARYASATIGVLSFCELNTSPAENTILPHHRKGRASAEKLTLNIALSGGFYNSQLGNDAVVRRDDMCLVDNHYERRCRYSSTSLHLAIMVSRERIEALIGPSRLYAGLVIEGSLPSTSLVRSFFTELVRLHERLTPEAAERMAGIGVDLLVASIGERLGRQPPGTIHGTALTQRAKAYVEAHLGDPALDPPRLALAMGVSLRRLQQLFGERGQHVSDWIWERRLVASERRLASLGNTHVPLGTLARDCGFTSQAHFSRRFRDRFGSSPTEYRRAALLSATGADPLQDGTGGVLSP